jgi:hypothetical protein
LQGRTIHFPPPAHVSVNAAEYTNDKYGFSLNLPDEWQIAENPSPGIVVGATIPRHSMILIVAASMPGVSQSLNIDKASDNDLKEFAISTLNSLNRTSGGNMRLTSVTKGFIGNGYSAIWLWANGTMGNQPFKMCIVTTVADDNLYSVMCGATSNEFGNYKQEFADTLKSFRIAE